MKSVEYRIEVYKFVEELLGRELDKKEHNKLRKIMIEYVGEQGKNIALSKLPPKEYIYTCRDCQKIKRALGRSQAKNIKGTKMKLLSNQTTYSCEEKE